MQFTRYRTILETTRLFILWDLLFVNQESCSIYNYFPQNHLKHLWWVLMSAKMSLVSRHLLVWIHFHQEPGCFRLHLQSHYQWCTVVNLVSDLPSHLFHPFLALHMVHHLCHPFRMNSIFVSPPESFPIVQIMNEHNKQIMKCQLKNASRCLVHFVKMECACYYDVPICVYVHTTSKQSYKEGRQHFIRYFYRIASRYHKVYESDIWHF